MKKPILTLAALLLGAAACSSTAPSTTAGTTAGTTAASGTATTTAGGGSTTRPTGSTPGSTAAGAVPVYGKDDLDITTAVGQELVIELASNPSTGFSWTYTQVGNNLQLVSETKPSPSGPPGSGGTQRFTFKATVSGAVYLDFTYARSVPGPDDTKLRYDVTID